MITGFNTDVRHRDVVFHVQTEDKGTSNPCVESLVYVGGQILARKRAGYRSLLEQEGNSKAVAQLMERQHQSMIAEIRAGKMDDKVAALKRPAKPPAASTQVKPPPSSPAPAARPPEDASTAVPQPMPPVPAKPPAAARPPAAVKPPPAARPPAPAAEPPEAPPPRPPAVPPTRPPAPPPRPRGASAVQPPPPKPAPASGKESRHRSLDQVILDYLEMESGQDKLVLTMDCSSGELTAGAEATVRFHTKSSVDADPIGRTRISVRLISTVEPPKLLGEGRTDDRGDLELRLEIPELRTGNGALIVSAESSIGNAEIRHLI